jgi:hypothetical protein
MHPEERDLEWEALRAAFRVAPAAGGAPAAEFDRAAQVAKIVARASATARRQALAVAFEVAAAVFVTAFYVHAALRGAPPVILAIGAASSVLMAVWLGYLFHVRRATWRAPAESVVEHVRLAQRRRHADVRWHLFVQRAAVVFGLVVVAWTPFVLQAGREEYLAEPWRAVVGFGGIAVILGGVAWHNRRKFQHARREADEVDALVRELEG